MGKGLRTKVNANLGRSTERSAEPEELRKLDVALKAGADFVMDLSVGADLTAIRQGMLEASNVNVVEELVDMIECQRAYEVNSKMISATDDMLKYVDQNL